MLLTLITNKEYNFINFNISAIFKLRNYFILFQFLSISRSQPFPSMPNISIMINLTKLPCRWYISQYMITMGSECTWKQQVLCRFAFTSTTWSNTSSTFFRICRNSCEILANLQKRFAVKTLTSTSFYSISLQPF